MSCGKPTGWLCCASRMERQLECSWGREEEEEEGWFWISAGEVVVVVADGVAEEGLGL